MKTVKKNKFKEENDLINFILLNQSGGSTMTEKNSFLKYVDFINERKKIMNKQT